MISSSKYTFSLPHFKTKILLLLLAGSVTFHNATQAQSYNALSFDGSNDYVSLPSSTPVPVGNSTYTIEAWFKPNSTGSYGIVGWGSYGSANQCNALRTNGNALMNYWWSNDLNKTTSTLSGSWHHVAATFDGTNRCLYLDGSLLGCDQPTGHNVPNANNLRIGSTNNGEYFNGSIDEVRIWNRALCAAELQNNMNGELPDPGSQAGLVAYYKADQGSASNSNSGVTTLIDSSANGNNGTLNNFALSGSSSNWVSGPSAISGTVSAYAVNTPSSTHELITKPVSGTTQIIGCNLLATLTPSGGGTALSGSVTTEVTLDASVGSYNGQAYVQRHYDIEPATNANTATATVVLYYTQAEFTAFNAARGSLPALPVDAADAANNKANLRITQYHGVPTGGHAPGNYPSTWGGSGPAHVLLTPSSVTWNSTYSRWEVTCSVTGFSGFFASTTSQPLPLKLISFTALRNSRATVQLHWRLAQAAAGALYFVTRSTDGKNFETLDTLVGAGQTDFQFQDMPPAGTKVFYRLRILDPEGLLTYSETESIGAAGNLSLHIYPVPAHDYFIIQSGTLFTENATLTDLQGRVLLRASVHPGSIIRTGGLQPGLYLLRVGTEVLRVVIE